MSGSPILTAAEMRAAEQAAVRSGVSEAELMARAGAAAAEAIRLYAGALPALVLCGPGNNGGDGYVIAQRLRAAGQSVRVVAFGDPRREPAASAAKGWGGPVERIDEAAPAPLLIDALFGTGLTRGLDEGVSTALRSLAERARLRIAVDLPSGIDSDTGAVLSPVPDFDLTVTFGSLKPAHLLQPGARHMGRVVVADIGVACSSRLQSVGRPKLAAAGPDDHKYKRGYVAVQAGAVSGAAALAAWAAFRAGAGYVGVTGTGRSDLPLAAVQGISIDDRRIGALVIGPGLGRDAEAGRLLDAAFASGAPLVLDADALHLLSPSPLAGMPILTPHAGEFSRLFGAYEGSKVEATRAAAATIQAVVLFKGADTVIAAPDGRAAIIAPPPALATAGTGDVLSGVIGAMRARGLEPFEAACAGAWLHARAGELAGPGLIADDLLDHLTAALEECA